MAEKIVFLGNKLMISGQDGMIEREFQRDIKEEVECQDKIFIRIKYVKGDRNNNILCLNEKGEILWQIQDPDELSKSGKKTDSPFVGLYIRNGVIRAANWNSFDYDINLENGKLSNPEFTK